MSSRGNGNGNSQPGPSRAPVALPEPDPELVELLSRLLLPLDIGENPVFRELMADHGVDVPSEGELREHVAGAEIEKVDWSKLKDSPITVTIDLEGSVNKKFVVASVHYFEGLVEKKTTIYFQRLMPNRVEARNILNLIQEAVGHPSFSERKFENMVLATPELTKLFEGRNLESEHVLTCFYHHISQFANKLLEVHLSSLLGMCQEHTRLLNNDPIISLDFEQFLKQDGSGHLEIPVYEARRWEDAYVYLTQLSSMNPIFTRYHTIKQGPQFLNNTIFASLVYFQQILHQCIEICRDLNHPDNSISSIIPAIHQLRNHLVANPAPPNDSKKCNIPPLGTLIVNLMETCFNDILHGPNQHFYEIATLLDPRFAYKDEYFPHEEWITKIEAHMLMAFEADPKKCNALAQEYLTYRDAARLDRPGLQASPLKWWDARKDTLGNLLLEAKKRLCCPAVSIDAKFFFGDGGRFSHLLAHHYLGSSMKSLQLAAQHQSFHGKGEHGKRILSMLDPNRNRMLRMLLEGPDSDDDDDEVEEHIEEERKPEHLLPDVTVQQKNSSNSALDKQVKEEEPDVEVPALRLDQRTVPQATVSQSTVARAPIPSTSSEEERKPEHLLPDVTVQQKNSSDSALDKQVKEEEPDVEVPAPRLDQRTVPKATVSQSTVARASSASRTAPRGPPPKAPRTLPEIPNVHPTVAAQEGTPQVGRIQRSTSQYQNHKMYRSPLTVSPGLRAVQAQQKAVGAEKKKQNLDRSKVPQATVSQKTVARAPIPSTSSTVPGIPLPRPDRPANPEVDRTAVVQETKRRKTSTSQCHLNPSHPEYKLYEIRHRYQYINCAICQLPADKYDMDKLTDNEQKFVLATAYIHKSKFDAKKGKWFLAPATQTFICKYHIREAVEVLYDMLQINYPDDIKNASRERMEHAVGIMKSISSKMTEGDVKALICKFLKDHLEHKPDVEPIIHDPAPGLFVDEEEPIVPKSQRQPRKQKLEANDHIVAQPVPKKPTSNVPPPSRRPELHICVFCSKRTSESQLTLVPRQPNRLGEWIKKLGPDFERRVDAVGDNYICRSHFPKDAFHLKGTLKAWAIPMEEGEVKKTQARSNEEVDLDSGEEGGRRGVKRKVSDVEEDEDEDWDEVE